MKWAGAIFLLAFLISAFFVAPFLAYDESEKKTATLAVINSNLLAHADALCGPVEVSKTFMTYWVDKSSKDHRALGSPTTANGQDQGNMALRFNVTNPNGLDMQIDKIDIEIRAFDPYKVIGSAMAGEASSRQYVCNIKTNLGFYPCSRADGNEWVYIKLKMNELEHFVVRPRSEATGVFQIAVWIEYFIGDQKKRQKVGEVPGGFGFFSWPPRPLP